MYNFNMFSRCFAHASSSTWYKRSEFINWDFGSKDNDVTFYIDGDMIHGINEKNDGKRKFLWGLESPQYNDDFINRVKNRLDDVLETYEMIFTYSDELLSLDPKFVFCPAGGYWIEDAKICEKTKLVSMICSGKQKTEQQKFRVDFANSHRDKIDVLGHIYVGMQKKEDGLNDYMFSVCIENDTYDTYFTEKILDAFATGTIPVYKGTRNVVNHFNSNGILFLDDINIDDLTEDLYYSKLEYVKDNFERIKDLNVLEDWMYKNYLKEII